MSATKIIAALYSRVRSALPWALVVVVMLNTRAIAGECRMTSGGQPLKACCWAPDHSRPAGDCRRNPCQCNFVPGNDTAAIAEKADVDELLSLSALYAAQFTFNTDALHASVPPRGTRQAFSPPSGIVIALHRLVI